MLILYNYKELSLKTKKYSINKFLNMEKTMKNYMPGRNISHIEKNS